MNYKWVFEEGNKAFRTDIHRNESFGAPDEIGSFVTFYLGVSTNFTLYTRTEMGMV